MSTPDLSYGKNINKDTGILPDEVLQWYIICALADPFPFISINFS
jgi:hypothetical protein